MIFILFKTSILFDTFDHNCSLGISWSEVDSMSILMLANWKGIDSNLKSSKINLNDFELVTDSKYL